MSGEGRTAREEFILEQYRQLGAGIARQHALRWEWQKFGVIGTFGFYAVVFAKDFALDAPLLSLALWLPVLLNALGLVVSYGIRMSARQMAVAVERMETEFSYEGWERSQAKRRSDIGNIRSLPTTVSTYVFWVVMTTVTATVALIYG